MTTAYHDTATGTDNHGPYVAKFANAAARLADAATYQAHQAAAGGNNPVRALQMDDLSEWYLASIGPTVWTRIVSAPAAHASSHLPGGTDALTTAAPSATGVATASAEGVAASFARSDHAHQSNTAASTIQPDDAATVGTSAEPARADHKHAIVAAAPSQGIGGGNAEGASTSFSRADHDHKLRETGGPTDLNIAAVADGKFLKRSGTTIVGDDPPGGVTETVELSPKPMMPYSATSLQVNYNGTLQGGVFEIDRDITMSKVRLRSGVSLSGTFTARVCIYQATDGGGASTWTKVFDGTFTESVGTSATFDVTNGGGSFTLKKGRYALLLGRSSGTGSPYIQTLDNLDSDLWSSNNGSGVCRTLWDGGNSASSPPATINAHTVTAGTGDLSPCHRLLA
jgi:hypothetical protein